MEINRRYFLALGACGLVRGATVQYRDYSKCLPDYMRGLATSAYERRNRALNQLTDASAIRKRQTWVRDVFWQLTGGAAPERTPLNLRTLGSFERQGYRVEKIVYESIPGLHIPGNLYLPAIGKPPYPGILFQMGHSLNGKCAVTYQKCCQGLASLGYAVLAFDPMGQGERTYYPTKGGTTTRLPSADDEHTIAGQQMILAGDTATRMQAWDAIRSLDVLAAHPLVDARRLGATGQSGGGTLTMMLAALDDRLAAAVVSCGNTENFACANFNPPGSTDDAEQNFIGSAAVGFDRWDLLYPFAPKPLLVMASARDSFGTYSPRYVSSGREEFGKLQRVYTKLRAPARLAWDETPAPHALSYFLRTRIYSWFEHWLNGKPLGAVNEPPVAPEKEQTLWVGATGNVVRDFGSKTPHTLVKAMAGAFRPNPIDKQRLTGLLSLDPLVGRPAAMLGRVPSEKCDIAAIEVETTRGVYAPAWLFLPAATDPAKPVLLIVEPNGRSARWAEGGLYHQLAAAGIAVCAADLRGIGDLSPEAGRGNQGYTIAHASEDAYAWGSLILGKPLLGQRTTDIIATVRALSSFDGLRGRQFVLAARGSLTVPALMAMALEPLIDRAYLAGGLVSFRSVLDFDEYRHPAANLVYGIARETDLPAIAALAFPRRIVLAGAVDGRGDPARAASVYEGMANVEIRAEASWDGQSLGATTS